MIRRSSNKYKGKNMVHISEILSHAILQSVRDTAHRFEDSEGGKQEWSFLLKEIYSSLETNVPNLDREVIADLGSCVLYDHGDQCLKHNPKSVRAHQDTCSCSECWVTNAPAIMNEYGAPIWRWSLGTNEARRERQRKEEALADPVLPPTGGNWEQLLTSRQTAWFLERLRVLCIESGENGLANQGLPECTRFLGAFLTASGPTISWRTMIEYIQFIMGNSNWIIPVNISYIDLIDKSHEWLMKGRGTAPILGYKPRGDLHNIFNAVRPDS